MTATPIADDPMEFVKLMNLLIGNPNMRFTTIYKDFVKEYMNKKFNFSYIGINKFQNRIKGLISYLNRSNDPRQFAQPIFHKVEVPISGFDYDPKILYDITNNCEKLANDLYDSLLEENNLKDVDIDEEYDKCVNDAKINAVRNVDLTNYEGVKNGEKKMQKEIKRIEKTIIKDCKKQHTHRKKIINKSLKSKEKEFKSCMSKKKKELKEFLNNLPNKYQKNALEKCGIEL